MRVSVVRDGDTDMGDRLQAAWLFLAVGLILRRDLGLANALRSKVFGSSRMVGVVTCRWPSVPAYSITPATLPRYQIPAEAPLLLPHR